MVVLAATYILLARLGLSLATVERSVTLVWPPSGLALAALFLFGLRLWPGVAVGALLVNALTPGVPWPTAVGMALGNTAEAVLGAGLLRWSRFDPGLRRPRDVVKLVILAASISTAASAVIGSLSLQLGGVVANAPGVLGNVMRVWWLGDLMGDLIFAPLLLVWLSRDGRETRLGSWAEGGVLLLLLAFIFAMAAVVFHRPASFVFGAQPYAIFPLLIWAALRFGPRGSVAANFVVSVVSVWATVRALGPFGPPSLGDSLQLLQMFVATVALTSLILGATAAARVDAMRAREDFISVAAHEIRTPLTALQLQVQRLRRAVTRDDRAAGDQPSSRNGETAAMIDLAERQIVKMTNLAEVLLDLARLRTGDLRLSTSPTDLVALLRECAESLEGARRLSAGGAGPAPVFDIRVAGPDDSRSPIIGRWDRTRLQQVLANLLGNAVKYGAGQPVMVTVSTTSDTATVDIQDRGPGIAAQDQERIFRRYERGVVTGGPPGFGLGLHIAREIVSAHGGTISVSSTPGNGATFSVSLPLLPLRKRTRRLI
jgi:signal transduction histidine kinase